MADLSKIDLSAPAPDVLTWGKHNGRSVVEVQLTDPSYVQWMLTQAWVQEKHPVLYQIILNGGVVPNETPEHNWYQALFLDEKFAAAVFDARLPGKREDDARRERDWKFLNSHTLNELRDRAKTLRRNIEHYSKEWPDFSPDYLRERAKERDAYQAKLNEVEEKLAPLESQYAAEMARAIDPSEMPPISVEFEAPHRLTRSGPADVQMMADHWRLIVRVEIKPSMGDDYPAVLRQMKGSQSDTLYLAAYTGQRVTLDQVKQIFKASGIVVLMHADFARFVQQQGAAQ